MQAFKRCAHARTPESALVRADGTVQCRVCRRARRLRAARRRGVQPQAVGRSPLCALCPNERSKHNTYCNPCAAAKMRASYKPKERVVKVKVGNVRGMSTRRGKSSLCSGCGAARDGAHQSYCKPCCAAKARARRLANKPAVDLRTLPRFNKTASKRWPHLEPTARSQRSNPRSVLHPDLAKWAKQATEELRRAA